MFRNLKVLILLSLFAQVATASVRLPIHRLRIQSNTPNCWAYAMSNMLESRALVRESLDFMFHIQQDTRYWVTYERMMFNYRNKSFTYSGAQGGAWQIEFFDTLLKHGKHIYASEIKTPEVLYPILKTFSDYLAFIPGSRSAPQPNLPTWDTVVRKLHQGFPSEADAQNYVLDYLDRYYGKPLSTTQWLGASVDVSKTAELVLGTDFAKNSHTEAVALVKPVYDQDHKWVRYLDKRYWGYRYDARKILQLIRMSLDNGWPVTFDNVYHAMTIVGYETTPRQGTYYAVADSSPGTISWYSSGTLMSHLNLVTFFLEAIPGELPDRPSFYPVEQVDYDKLDNVEIPPM